MTTKEKYRIEHKEEKKEYDRLYRSRSSKKDEYNKDYVQNHKVERNEYAKKYQRQHIAYTKNYRKQRRRTDIHFKLLENLRTRIYQACFKNSKVKEDHTIILLGCSIIEFKTYLESKFKEGMSWNNYSIEWEIDHIRPCSSFDLTDIKQQKECFHYTNTQPLWKYDNRSKGGKL
jgi:hypothetical protein